MALRSKVTVASVKRQWEKKYAELNDRYDTLCRAHVVLGRQADFHRNNETRLQEIADHAQKMAVEALANNLRKDGVISYLEQMLNTVASKTGEAK